MPGRAVALASMGRQESNLQHSDSETDVPPIELLPKNQDPRRAAGNRTLVGRLKAGCSAIELQPQDGGGSVCFRSVNMWWEWRDLNSQCPKARGLQPRTATNAASLPETKKATRVSLGGLSV